MAKEVIEKIKAVEVEVTEKIKSSQSEAKEMINNAILEADETYKKILKEANEEKQKLFDKAKADGEMHCELIGKNKNEQNTLLTEENMNVDAAVKKIIERIVSVDGNI